MKKSELKNEIKNYIYEILSEADVDPKSGAVVMKKGTNPNDIKKVTSQGIDVELREESFNEDDYDLIRSEVDVDRKPYSPEYVDSKTDFNSLSPKIQQLIKSLPVYDIEPEIFEDDADGFYIDGLTSGDQYAILKVNNQYFFVDTQGYDYARYVGEILNFPKNLNEEEDSTPDDETIDKQAKAAAKKEKIQGPSKFKVPNSEFEDFKTKLKTLVKKIKAMEKGAEKDKKMAALKQFIKKPELVKAFKERDVKIDTDGLVGENRNKLNEIVTPPTFERLHDKEGIKGYINNKYKIVRFAFDDEGNNAFALLDMKNKKLISYSLTGESERKKFNEYNKTLK